MIHDTAVCICNLSVIEMAGSAGPLPGICLFILAVILVLIKLMSGAPVQEWQPQADGHKSLYWAVPFLSCVF
jgi:hypothetical protein